MTEWTYLVEAVKRHDDGPPLPCAAMRHNPSGVTFYMATPINGYRTPVCSYPANTPRRWTSLKQQEKARAEYERLLAAAEIPMRCEFCRIEGRAFVRGLCLACSLLCWCCGETATVSEIPSESYRAGDSYALPPATYCAGCFAEAELEREARAHEIAESGITDADIPF